MIYRICDFCGRTESEKDIQARLPYIATVQIEKQSGVDYVFGKKTKFEMCTGCFESKFTAIPIVGFIKEV